MINECYLEAEYPFLTSLSDRWELKKVSADDELNASKWLVTALDCSGCCLVTRETNNVNVTLSGFAHN